MKAKLHKMLSGYLLSLNGDIDDPYAIVNEQLADDYGWYKLSLKNCQVIERGYDLDELANEYFMQEWAWIKSSTEPYSNETVDQVKKDFVSGFQKALELMGDKKFSEKDMLILAIYCWNTASKPRYGATYNINEIVDNFIKSLQQTEWDVEIEMDAIPADRAPGGWDRFPKLDGDGCLILRRKSE